MRLVVFFSRGMSLGAWSRSGILDRELALYRVLRPERATLSLVPGPDGAWEIDQLLVAANRPVEINRDPGGGYWGC